MRKLELRLEARTEFLQAIDWYEQRRKGLGSRFKAEVDRVLARIQTAPLHFPEIEPGYRRALVDVFPYGIFFVPKENEIVVLAVLHHRRDPETWKARR
jgi:plasmid stabilization system protein ParE